VSGSDVAVVGGGIIGVAVAYACARRGARVTLLERSEPGAGASGMAAGMLTPASEALGPGPFLDLSRHSLGLWPELAAELQEATGLDCGLELSGLLRVAGDEAEAVALRERLAWQRATGIAGSWLAADEAASVEPALLASCGAVLYPEEGRVVSGQAVRALLAACRQRGVEVRCGVEVVGPAAHGLALGDGSSVDAESVVLAAGPWTGRLAAAWGVRLPLRAVRGELLGLRELHRPPQRVLYAGGLGYVLARRDGMVVVGSTEEEAALDAELRPKDAPALWAIARRLLRGAGSAVAAGSWVGLRPATPDGLPILGEVTMEGASGPRVLVATGHYRNGVLLAPATAEGIASRILQRAAAPVWTAFAVDRFAG
jgi:glycine oxidase